MSTEAEAPKPSYSAETPIVAPVTLTPAPKVTAA